MMKKLHFKFLLLLCALMVGSASVWAGEVTFTFNTDEGIAALGITKPSPSSGTDLNKNTTYTINGVSLKVTHGSTNTRVWNSGGTLDLRIYKSGGSLTFTAPTIITKIELSGSAVGNFSANVGTFSAGTWTGNAKSVKLTASNTGKINTIKVTYLEITPTVNDASMGSVALDNSTIIATPNDGYRVIAGDGGYTVTSGTATVTNNGDNTFSVSTSVDCTVQINFETIPSYTITTAVNNSEYGRVSDNVTIFEGATTTITATPNTNYRVIAGDGGYTVSSGTATVTNNGNNTFTVTPSSDCTVQINFELIPSYTITTEVNNSEYGSVSSTVTIHEGESTTITATPNTNYRVVAGDGGYTVTSGTATVTNNGNNTFTVSPSTDCTVTINFEEIPTRTLSSAVTPANSGSVELGSSSLREGSTTTATATPASGYIFKSWSIEGEGSSISSTTENPVTVTMGTADATITAHFAPVYTITWNVNGQIKKTMENVEVDTDISLEFPVVANLGGKVFRGWVTTQTVAEDYNEAGFVNTSSAVAPANNLVYYAVFATATETPVVFNRYEKVTSAPSDWSGTYLLGATYNGGNTESYKGTWIFSGPNSGGTYGDKVAIGQLTDEKADCEIVIARSDHGYTIYHENSDKYFSYDGSNNELNFADAVSDEAQEWTISGVAVINNVQYSTRKLQYNGSSPRFACYISSQVATDLYKRIESGGVAYSGYTTSVTVPVTITSAEYATYHTDYAVDFSTNNIKAYTAKDGESSVKLNEITSGQVPANTCVVLYKAGGGTFNVPVIASATAISGTNDLRVVEDENGITGENIYVLAKPQNKEVGFYLWASNATLNHGKVYLQASNNARSFLGFNEESSIGEIVNSELSNGKYFDLQGRRVAQPTKGLYIVNGKKVIIK